MTESQEPTPAVAEQLSAVPSNEGAEPAAAEPVLTCPIDGSTNLKHIPTSSPHFTCMGGCGKVWHESDLIGERFDYLKAHP